jgi:hypothetical protein
MTIREPHSNIFKEFLFLAGRKRPMIKLLTVFAIAELFCVTGDATAQQYPILDMVANKVVQHYQVMSCQQLSQQRQEPKSPREEEMAQNLRNDPQMAQAFISKVAVPIANKLFECGLIP